MGMSDISTFYGGSVLSLRGAQSALILADNRLGSHSITTSMNFKRIHQVTPKTFIGMSMFAPDGQVLAKEIIREANSYEVTHGRHLNPGEIAKITSHHLYS